MRTENGASATFSTKRSYFPSLVGDGSAPATLAPSMKSIFEILRGDNIGINENSMTEKVSSHSETESNGFSDMGK